MYHKKKANDIHQGKWNGLGGKFEPGESPEELGVECEVLEEFKDEKFTTQSSTVC